MKELVQKLYAYPAYARVAEWGKILSLTFFSQLIIQSVGLIGGILIVRFLSSDQYGFYILATTMLGTMILLADGGISPGVMSVGGRVWQDREKLGVVLSSGMALRKKMALLSLVLTLPVLFYMLHSHGATVIICLRISSALVLVFYASLSGNILEVVPKLQQNIIALQKIQIISNVSRLFLVSLLLIAFPFSFIALAIAFIPQLWTNLQLRKLAFVHADYKKDANPEVKKEILQFVKRILPGSIYYSVSGQISIWLISIFGSVKSIAQVGALGRLAVVLNIFTVLFSTIISPRFARLPNHSKLLLNRYLQIQIALVLLVAFIITGVSLFPSEVLWVLGSEYANLEKELVLVIASAGLSLIAGSTFALCAARGWIIKPFFSISIEIIAIIIGALFLNISSLRGILIFNIVSVSAVQLIMYTTFGFLKCIAANKDHTP
ncbi:MAG: polysaccharide biosynthesis protein [Ilyomonas sp.]